MHQSNLPIVDPTLIGALGPRVFGAVCGVEGPKILIEGLRCFGRVGLRVSITRKELEPFAAEILGVERGIVIAYAFGSPRGIAAGDRATLDEFAPFVRPSADWLGRVVNWRGETVVGLSPATGERAMLRDASAPAAATRKKIGERLSTRLPAFNTFIPICRGQRIGIFAGSGVGKSTLLSDLAAGMAPDVCVIALIGERGREVLSFVEAARSAGFLERSIIIASTSDEPALVKRESARLALAVSEYFRSEGQHVLLIFDSLTRFAESHREIALACGEPPSLHAFPPSTVNALASLVERAGPGPEGEGDITAVFSVLVAGSDMDEPVADMVRGLLDGHVVLDRAIAERGRFPAINIRRSISRALPGAASDEENSLLLEARALIAAYENAELIIRAGLYAPGSDPQTDRAIALWPRLDAFVALSGIASPDDSFALLREILASAPHPGRSGSSV